MGKVFFMFSPARAVTALLVLAGFAGMAQDVCVVRGTFVQKKFLHDVGVTLASSGTWSFEKDRAFAWNTLKPVPSQFVATPTNYSFSVAGKTTSRRLDMKISNLAQVFEMKEMKGVVDRVEQGASDPVFKADGVEIPSSMYVIFKNGDRLDIKLAR
jgi:hypothetical protein